MVAVLDTVESLHAARLSAEADMFVLATRFADLQAGESLARGVVAAERAVRLGGVGTPRVREFACAELGARMQLGTVAARHYLADALDVRHRLPLIWARVLQGRVRIGWVREVATRTRHLSPEAAGLVDAAMVECVDGSLPWGRFVTRLAGKVVAADPVLAGEREADAAAEQLARRSRSSTTGMASFFVRSSVGVIARVEATVAYVAEGLRVLGDTEAEDLRRVKALLLLCNPCQAVEMLAAYAAARAGLDPDPQWELPLDGPAEHPADESVDALARMDAFARRVRFTPTRLPSWLTPPSPGGCGDSGAEVRGPQPEFMFDWPRLLPTVALNVHVSAESLAARRGGVARLEGEGPVTEQFVHDYLRPVHAYRIQPVIDLAALAPVDGYEIPDRHRRAVHLRTPADSFPFSSNLDARVDVDHTVPYDPARARQANAEPQTRLDNLAPLGRFHHRIKTHGAWSVKQPFDGIMVWRDPHGQVYVVDHTGTHKVTRPGNRAGPPSTTDPEVEVYPTDVVIEVDFGPGVTPLGRPAG